MNQGQSNKPLSAAKHFSSSILLWMRSDKPRQHRDGTKEALPKLSARKPGDPHPLIVGKESVQRYMTIVGECAKAGALMAK